MINIIGFAGKKQSGKNTAANFIMGAYLVELGIVRGNFSITNKGELAISDIHGNTDVAGVIDLTTPTPDILEFKDKYVSPYIKLYGFADLLKQEVCMKILGLTYEQCYGTDEQKNQMTKLCWENMPGYQEKQTGQMTARDTMQYIGTNIFRKMYNDVWVHALIRQIQHEQPLLAIITDCRFPNEVEGIQNVGGRIIKLTRFVDNEDKHLSETALDKDNFDLNKFDYILDNKDMSIPEQNDALYEVLREWDCIPELK